VPTVHSQDYNVLLSSLDHALEILARNRSSDPIVAGAYQRLKETKAIVIRELNPNEAQTTRSKVSDDQR